MSSGKKAYPPLIRGKKYKFLGTPDGTYYVGCLQTVLETAGGLRVLFQFGDGKVSWFEYSHCTETDEPVSLTRPPTDGYMINRLRWGTGPAITQSPSASAFPFAGAILPNNPAGQAAPVGQRGGYAAPPPAAGGGRGAPGNGRGQYAGAPYQDGRGIPTQGMPPHAGNAAPGQGGPYYGVPPGQAAPYNAAHGYQGTPAYGQGNVAAPPPGYGAPNYGTGNTAAPGYMPNYYGIPGAGASDAYGYGAAPSAGASNTQGYGTGGYGAPGNGGAPGGTSSSSGQN